MNVYLTWRGWGEGGTLVWAEGTIYDLRNALSAAVNFDTGFSPFSGPRGCKKTPSGGALGLKCLLLPNFVGLAPAGRTLGRDKDNPQQPSPAANFLPVLVYGLFLAGSWAPGAVFGYVKDIFTECQAPDEFSNPLVALIPKIPFSRVLGPPPAPCRFRFRGPAFR